MEMTQKDFIDYFSYLEKDLGFKSQKNVLIFLDMVKDRKKFELLNIEFHELIEILKVKDLSNSTFSSLKDNIYIHNEIKSIMKENCIVIYDNSIVFMDLNKVNKNFDRFKFLDLLIEEGYITKNEPLTMG